MPSIHQRIDPGHLRVLEAHPHVRLNPWPGRTDAVHLSTATDQPIPVDRLSVILDDLRAEGVSLIRTSALGSAESEGFLTCGFEVAGCLALLSCGLQQRVGRSNPGCLRRGRARDHDALLELDARCFPEFWRFDRSLLIDAIEATPIARFRVAADPSPYAYAVTGVAGTTAYLQRLAVDPHRQRSGAGRALVDDARWWAMRRGAVSMLVNTAVDNTAALRFYERLEFERRGEDLYVLEYRIHD